MKDSILLSYHISNETPLYGNATDMELTPDKRIVNGNSCNTMNLSFPNHSGTHIDFPYHFNPHGKTSSDYSADFWAFDHVEIVDFSDNVADRQLIGPEMFSNIENEKTDLLLIKTGYGIYRGSDHYTLTPPGLSSKLAVYLREHLPKLRCVGVDLISISSYSNREEGHKAHHAFLNPDDGKPILLIEDMKLDTNGPFDKVIVAPLLIEHADGVPCTVFAYTDS